MSDQGIWFKLWCAALDDPDLDNLSLEQWARWAKLGAYIKKHGNGGALAISPPASALCSFLKCVTIDNVIVCISELPNVTVTTVTNETVTYKIEWKNWLKFQGDSSYHRVKKFRAKKRESVTPKKRREEKRSNPVVPGDDFESWYSEYPRKESRAKAEEAWKKIKSPDLTAMLVALGWQKESSQWTRDGGKYIPLPATYLNAKKWEDEPITLGGAVSYGSGGNYV